MLNFFFSSWMVYRKTDLFLGTGVGKCWMHLVNFCNYLWSKLDSATIEYLLELPQLRGSKNSARHKRVFQNKSCPNSLNLSSILDCHSTMIGMWMSHIRMYNFLTTWREYISMPLNIYSKTNATWSLMQNEWWQINKLRCLVSSTVIISTS